MKRDTPDTPDSAYEDINKRLRGENVQPTLTTGVPPGSAALLPPPPPTPPHASSSTAPSAPTPQGSVSTQPHASPAQLHPPGYVPPVNTHTPAVSTGFAPPPVAIKPMAMAPSAPQPPAVPGAAPPAAVPGLALLPAGAKPAATLAQANELFSKIERVVKALLPEGGVPGMRPTDHLTSQYWAQLDPSLVLHHLAKNRNERKDLAALRGQVHNFLQVLANGRAELPHGADLDELFRVWATHTATELKARVEK